MVKALIDKKHNVYKRLSTSNFCKCQFLLDGVNWIRSNKYLVLSSVVSDLMYPPVQILCKPSSNFGLEESAEQWFPTGFGRVLILF